MPLNSNLSASGHSSSNARVFGSAFSGFSILARSNRSRSSHGSSGPLSIRCMRWKNSFPNFEKSRT